MLFRSSPSTTGYTVVVKDSTCTNAVTTATGSSSPITVTGLSNGTSYCFAVKATNTVGDSALSGTGTKTPDAAQRGAVTSFTATPGVEKVTLNWQAPSPAPTAYTIAISPNTGTAGEVVSGGEFTGVTGTSKEITGLAGGTLRIIHTFLVPIYGTRHVVAISTLLLLIPAVGWFYAVQDPTTPYWMLMTLAFLAGLGGGNFSSFMPSTSLFFPKRLQGTALAIQAGVGNFGVSVVQFVTPWIIGFVLVGTLAGEPQTFTRGNVQSSIWLQNATLIYIPFILVFGVLAWLMLRSVPVRANFREQVDIFKMKHAFFMTLLYIMTFGSFSGLSATFPLLIRQIYGEIGRAHV